LIVGGAVAMLRPLKAGLIALQYRHHLLVASPLHEMIRFRPLLWPTLTTLPMLLLLLALGAWQVERLFWKEDLIAQRQAAVAATPVPVPRSLEEARGMEFRHVTDEGVFLHDKEIFLGATSEAGEQGYQVLTPLLEPSGRIVFVNRGFIPAELKDPAKRPAGQIGGTVRVQGLLRLPPDGKPNWFLPDNRPDLNYWFWVDIPAMSAADKIEGVAPFYIDADATPNPGGWPKGGVTRLALPNNHLQYAITWFSLAVALIVIYVLYHRRNPGAR
jgi:surfeit locus 1 family protein